MNNPPKLVIRFPSESRRIRIISLLRLSLILTLLFILSTPSLAQTGKIAGRVTDSETGAALIDANVIIEETPLGSATDINGEYFILNVSPGTYEITSSLLGYSSKKIIGVQVNSGQTTWLNLSLVPSVLQMDEVVVTWEKPPVDLQETSSRSVVRQELLEELPVETITQALELQAGAVTDAYGELHLRGGRSGEIVYYVDGQRIENPITGESSLFINREAVQELTLLSGTFNAEYGDAMSGVVQIITREGGDDLSVNVEYLSPMINSSPYRETDWAGKNYDVIRDADGNSLYEPNDVLDEPTNILGTVGRLALTTSGPLKLADNTHFFISGMVNNENGYLPFGYEQERSLIAKITQSYGSGGKISFSTGMGWENYQTYNHDWKYVPEHYHKHFLRDTRYDLRWTHPLSKRAFFDVSLGYYRQSHDAKLFEEWDDYLESGYQQKDFKFNFYEETDWSDVWRESRTETYSLKTDGTFQYGNHHLLKSGIEARLLEIEMLDIRELTIDENDQPAGIIDSYVENPIELGAYIQDKIELSYMVVNAGIRLDYVDPRTEGWSNPENPDSGMTQVDAEYQFSPRLGLAHPINDRMSLYFAYGHFFQYPHYETLFMNSVDLNPDTLAGRAFDAVGNRSLKPQRTVAYEVGLKGNLSDNLGFKVTAFYKDITDLVGTKQVRIGTKYNYALFRNIDYASVIGVELGISRTFSDHWSFEGNYTYSVAKGNSSEPLEGFWNVYYQQPEAFQEYYLDFDRRHVLNAMLIWQSGAVSGGQTIKALLSDITLGATASWSSGLPYTPYTGAGERLALTNSSRMDPTATVDIRFTKPLVNTPVKVMLLAYVENLFDLTNDLRVNSRTGEPWESPTASDAIALDQLYNPSKVDRPRIIKIGLQAKF